MICARYVGGFEESKQWEIEIAPLQEEHLTLFVQYSTIRITASQKDKILYMNVHININYYVHNEDYSKPHLLDVPSYYKLHTFTQ